MRIDGHPSRTRQIQPGIEPAATRASLISGASLSIVRTTYHATRLDMSGRQGNPTHSGRNQHVSPAHRLFPTDLRTPHQAVSQDYYSSVTPYRYLTIIVYLQGFSPLHELGNYNCRSRAKGAHCRPRTHLNSSKSEEPGIWNGVARPSDTWNNTGWNFPVLLPWRKFCISIHRSGRLPSLQSVAMAL